MTLVRQFLIIVLIAGTAATAWMYLGPVLGPVIGSSDAARSRGGSNKRPAAVVAHAVGTAQERARIEVVGSGRAFRSATLYPAAAGEIIKINFTTDAPVTAGTVLLELDREAEQLAVELARIRVGDAERRFERLRRLKASGSIAAATFDDAQSAVAAARIEVKRAEVALADRHVVAPFDGRIGLSELGVGDRVDTGSAIASLDQRDTLLVRFEVPEALLGRIKPGDTVAVTPWSDRNATTAGTVFDVGSRVSEQSRSFLVRARIANPRDTLRPGMSFRVALEVVGGRYPMVPEVALQWGGDGSFLWVVEAGKVRRVQAAIVQRQGAVILVDATLQPGALVVIEGLHKMRDGKAVALRETGKSGNSGPAAPAGGS